MSFPPATEMFQFAGFASSSYGFTERCRRSGRVSPYRKSPDQSLLTAPRGLSQRATSFIAFWHQGIHQMPFSRLSFTRVQKQLRTPGRAPAGTRRNFRKGQIPVRTWRTGIGSFTLSNSGRAYRRDIACNPETEMVEPDGDRTDDLLLAKQALSHLSYGPVRVVGLGRLELPTSRLSGVRSNRLSYRPIGARPAQACTGHSGRKEMRRRRRAAIVSVRSMRRTAKRRRVVSDRIRRKEVIQPQVPLRLPCYDFTPVADLTVAGCLLTVSAPVLGKANSHGVTGGVYKARERIHRGMLIRDY